MHNIIKCLNSIVKNIVPDIRSVEKMHVLAIIFWVYHQMEIRVRYKLSKVERRHLLISQQGPDYQHR